VVRSVAITWEQTAKSPASLPGFRVSSLRREAERLLVACLLVERCTQDVAEGSAAVGGAVLSDSFLLFSDFQGLDRHGDPAGLLVELGNAGIELVADGVPIRPLFFAVAGTGPRGG